MTSLVIKDIKEFIAILISNEAQGSFRDIFDAYNNTLGGCGCNKKQRELYAKTTYEKIKDDPNNIQSLTKIKIKLNLESLVLESEGNFIIKI